MAYTLSGLLTACDATNLKAQSTEEDIRALCALAKKNRCASVCVNSAFVPLVAEELKNSTVKTCTVIGFPLGAMSTAGKAAEARVAIEQGADELDMVIEIGMMLAGKYDYILQDIQSVVQASGGKTVKVIIETCFLNDEQKIKVCELAKQAGAQFVKTSTGFGTAGATVSDVALMYHTVQPDMEVKASGGIRTAKDAAAMLEAGATRIGVSNVQSIIDTFGEYKA